MNTITVVEDDLDGFRGNACLVTDQDGNHFVVSTITREEFAHAYGDFETMAFRSDPDGNVIEWLEVCGGGDLSRQDVLDMLTLGDIDSEEYPSWATIAQGYDREMCADDEWEDWYRDDQSLLDVDNPGW